MSLATTRRTKVFQINHRSRVVASDCTTKPQMARHVVLSLTNHAKWCVGVWCVVAMSYCRSAQLEGLAICIFISQATGRQRAIWRALLATIRQCDNNISCVVPIDNATRKVFNISRHI
jgi:hypothetical protein